MSVDLMSEVPPASEVLTIGSFFGFRPLGNFRLALLSSLSFMALSLMAAFGTLTIVSERLKCGRKAVIVRDTLVLNRTEPLTRLFPGTES